MSQTHGMLISDGSITKTYVDWSRDEHRVEHRALAHISALVDDPVPTPLAAAPDADPPTLTMSIVPGERLVGPLSAPQRSALATALATLWSLPVGDLPRRRLVNFNLVRDALRAPGPEVSRLVKDARSAAAGWLDTPEHAALDDPYDRPVIGHGDPNLANYLWDGTRIRLVDFEDASVSDIPTELAILVEHLSARDTDWSDVIARFAPDPVRYRSARRRWSAFWLYLLLPGGPASRRNPPSTLEAQAERVLDLLS